MNLLKKLNSNIVLSIILFLGISFSIIKIVWATAPDPGHNFTEISGGVVQGNILYGSAADTLSALAKDTNTTRYLSNQGSSNNPSWNQVNLANGVTGLLSNANLANAAVANLSGTNTGDQTISDATISLSDITTGNFSTTKHGFVPKGTNAGNYLKDDGTWAAIAGGGDMVLASVQTVTGAKTFNDTKFFLRNVANTFNGSFVNTNTADRIYTLKDASGTLAFTSDITGTNSGTNTGDNAANSSVNFVGTTSIANNRASAAMALTGITSIDGSAATLTTPRTIAGTSFDGSANISLANKFIVQGTTDSGLSAAQFLGALGTGIVKNTTTTGVLSIATGADLPAMTATVGGAVPTPPNNTTTFLRGDGTFAAPAGGGDMVLASVQTVTGAKTFGTIGGAVGKLILAGSTSGSTILDASAIAGATTVTLPGTTGTLALLASPTFTGVPAAPTAATGTNTTQLATTAFVEAAVPNASYRTIAEASGSHTAAKVTGTYLLGDGDPVAISGTGTLYPVKVIHIAAADWPTVDGKTTKLKLKVNLSVNDVAPGGNITFGLYPITRPATSGGVGVDIYTAGTVVASSTVLFTAPAADALLTGSSADIALPTDGFYAIGVVNAATIAASSHLHMAAYLMMRNN